MEDLRKTSDLQVRVLCVEDDRDTCEIISILFPDYQVTFAHSISDAVSFFETRDFDLIILDNWLPDGSGLELCKIFHQAKPDIPIVFASGVGQKSEIQKALDVGAQKYLVKPYEPMNLQQIVKDLVEQN